jgi:bifunctional DNA-binding transcriptional regulator/antitoxin component of YhaV-PrlF toxin-antitoxin module
MSMSKRVKISLGGQISIPAAIRRRWGTTTLALQDDGERIVLTPLPDDPIAAAEGALAAEFADVDVDRLRVAARESEHAVDTRRRP